MDGFSRVKKKGRGPGAVEGSRNLSGHETALAHACEDDPSLGLQDQLNRLFEFRADTVLKVHDGLGLNFEDFSYLFDD